MNSNKNHRKPYNKTNGRYKKDFDGKKDNGNFKNFRPSVNSNPKSDEKANAIPSKFTLDGNNAVCSFLSYTHHDSRKTIENLGKILKSNLFVKVIVSIDGSSFNSMKSSILKSFADYENIISFSEYSSSSFDVHNVAFKLHKSDIFFVTDSGFEPRHYSLEILKRYIAKDGVLATTPVVYDESGNIQKHSLRILNLAMQIKMLFSENARNNFIMMERGEAGYYKIHKISATLSPFFVNSKVFAFVGGFGNVSDDLSSRLSLFKKIGSNGNILFVPTARFIENAKPAAKISIFGKLIYFVKNIF